MLAETPLDTTLLAMPLEHPAVARILRALCAANRFEEATNAVARYLLRQGILEKKIPAVTSPARSETVLAACTDAVQAYSEAGGVLVQYVPSWVLASNMVTLWAGGVPRKVPVTTPLRDRLPEEERAARDAAAVLRARDAFLSLLQKELIGQTAEAYCIPKEKMEIAVKRLALAALEGFDSPNAPTPTTP